MPTLTYLRAEGAALVSLLSLRLPAERQLHGERPRRVMAAACSECDETAARAEAPC